MSSALGGELVVDTFFLGHEKVEEPVFLLIDEAEVAAGALVAADHSFLIAVVAHRLADFILNGLVLDLVAVFVVLFINLLRGVAYTEEEAGGEDNDAQDAEQQRHALDEAEHAEGGTGEEYDEGEQFAAMVLKD